MSHPKFIAPKKKRRVRETKESPFPVPVATITHEPAHSQKWFYYTGQLEGNHVVVKHSGDMEFLYKMGFFGKGTLSRSKPDYNQRHQTVTLPTDSGEITTAKVVNRRYYVRHLNWRNKQEDPSSVLHEEYDSTQETDDEQEEVKGDGNDKEGQEEVMGDGIDPKRIEDAKLIESDEIEDIPVPTIDAEWGDKVKSDDPWANTEADDDFWGSENEPKTSSEDAGKSWEATVDNDFSGTDTPQSDSKENNEKLQLESSQLGIEQRTENENGTLQQSDETNRKESERNEKKSQFSPLCKQEEEVIETLFEQEKEVEEGLDPLCTQEEEVGELFVIEDSDSETEGRKRKCRGLKWKPVLKTEHYHVKESLNLSFEESFFLAYGLGCLNCLNENQEPMNLSEMWRIFTLRRKSFLPCYIVYHYFRSKGWVPKSGLKFGTDFIVYKEGPPFYHGSYSVIVRMVDNETLADDPQYNTRCFTWTQLSGLNRVTEHVAKEAYW